MTQVENLGGKRKNSDSKKQPTLPVQKKVRSFAEQVASGNSIFGESIKSMGKEEREVKVNSVMKSMLPVLPSLAVKHDSSRVLQICIKYCNPELRDKIAQALSGHYHILATNVYGYHVVNKLLAYHGTNANVRDLILKDMVPNIKSLANAKDASKVVDFFWRRLSNERQKRLLLRPFYGREFELFAPVDNENPPSLDEIIKAEPHKSTNILHNIFTFLNRSSEKGLLESGLFHRLLLEYLSHAQFDQIRSITEEVSEHCKLLLQTKDGVRCVVKMLQYGTAKDRKHIVKSFKDYVIEMATDSEGYLALLSALSVVDDTILLSKAILSEIQAGLDKVIVGGNSRKVLLQILSPNNASYLSPHELESCLIVSGISQKHGELVCSKKDPVSRSNDLLKSFRVTLLDFCLQKMSELLCNRLSSDVIVELAKHLTTLGDEALLERFFNGISSAVEKTISSTDDSNLFSNAVSHVTLKRIIQTTSSEALISKLFSHLTEESTLHLLSTRATWVFAKMCEISSESRPKLIAHFKTLISSRSDWNSSPGFNALSALVQ